jgi:hypothetical protein
MDQNPSYEARHGWTGQTTKVVVFGAIFVALAALPIWSGRVRLDGILMPAAFLPVLRVVDVLLFGSFVVIALWRALTKKVALRVDRSGIAFGTGEQAGSVIPWAHIHAVEVFTRQVQSGRRTTSSPYVGVYRPVGGPEVAGAASAAGRRTISTPRGELVAVSRGITGVPFRQDHFVAAVNHFAPGIPVTISPDFASV